MLNFLYKKCIWIPQILKKSACVGLFSYLIYFTKYSSEIEISKLFRLQRAALHIALLNLVAVLDWLLCSGLPHGQRDNRFVNSISVFRASWNAEGTHQSCMAREWVLLLVEAPFAPSKTLRTTPVRRVGCLENKNSESAIYIQQKTFVFDQAWPTKEKIALWSSRHL